MNILSHNDDGTITMSLNEHERRLITEGHLGGFSIADMISAEVKDAHTLNALHKIQLEHLYDNAMWAAPHITVMIPHPPLKEYQIVD